MFVRVSVATTVAPGTAAPDESVTLPSSVPVTACACAAAGTMRAAPSTSARAAQTRENTLPDAFKLRRILLPPLVADYSACMPGGQPRGADFWAVYITSGRGSATYRVQRRAAVCRVSCQPSAVRHRAWVPLPASGLE